MKKRLLAITAILAAVVGAIVLSLALLPARPAVTKANFDRLEIGMSLDDVNAAFGGPHSISVSMPMASEQIADPRVLEFSLAWHGADGVVTFSEKEMRVINTTFYDEPTSFYQKLQRWLPWLQD